jgi:hypothetical protein
MVINKSKSGVMPFHNTLNTMVKDIDGYPIVKAYKYLGYYINDSLTITTHLKETAKKFNYIRWRLAGVRRHSNLRLTINLFKMLIMPLNRLAATTFHRLTGAAKKSAEIKIKVQFKLFCNLPVNMSD